VGLDPPLSQCLNLTVTGCGVGGGEVSPLSRRNLGWGLENLVADMGFATVELGLEQ
jgi:hypothetical protein